jgi:hypothetical protein
VTPINNLLQKKEPIFDIDYFIDHFQIISEDQLLCSDEVDVTPSDAWEWLTEDEADYLYALIRPFGILLHVNDGVGEWQHYGNSPKERVIRFLNFIKYSKTENPLE